MVKPISPQEIKKVIPDFVIEAVNELLNEKYTHGRFNILQKDIKERILTKTDQEFDWSWMDFESVFEAAGWHVWYDKPAYCETYDAFFTFQEKK